MRANTAASTVADTPGNTMAETVGFATGIEARHAAMVPLDGSEPH